MMGRDGRAVRTMAARADSDWRLGLASGGATFLTSLCLSPTISGGDWVLDALLFISLVTATGIWLRYLAVPKPLIPVAQLLVLAVLTIEMFASTATFHGIPTLSTINRIFTLTGDAFSAIWNQQPPLSETTALALVVTAGVGLVAVAVDSLAATWHRPIVAGVPLFVLYLVPAAVLQDGVPWPLFGLAAIGWLIIQLTDGRERLSHWGRVVGIPGQVTTNRSALTGTGRRLGATALVAAIAIPMVIPSIGEGVFGGGGVDQGSDGPSKGNAASNTKVITINPLVDLKRDLSQGADEVVFEYASTDPNPQYWRIATLDQFDGFTWTLADSSASADQQASAGLPTPPGLASDVARTEEVSDVQVKALNSNRLPLPYPVTNVEIDGDWRYDLATFDVFSAENGGNALGQEYVVSSLDVQPTSEQLSSAPNPSEAMGIYLVIPPEIRGYLQKRTAEVTATAKTDYDKAQAIQNWFRTEFTYSLDHPQGNDTNDLISFLKDRSGYCEQFAATMALMARAVGIPSRVQVGFTPGSQRPDGTWVVTSHDAHAWPELWFEGVGWVRFEPTPGGGDGNTTPPWAVDPNSPTQPATTGPQSQQGHPLRRTPLSGIDASEKERLLNRIDRSGSGVTGTPVEPGAGSNRGAYVLLLVLAGLLVGVAPFVTRAVLRARRWSGVVTESDAVQAAWADVLETATDLDLSPRPTETPRDLAARLPAASGLSQQATDDWQLISRAVERYRYGRDELTSNRVGTSDSDALIRDPSDADRERNKAWRERARSVEASLASVVRPSDRRRARWWPQSGRIALAAGWSRGMDAVLTAWQNLLRGGAQRIRRGDAS